MAEITRSNQPKLRGYLGSGGFWLASLFSSLALLANIFLVEYDRLPGLRPFGEQHPLILFRMMEVAMLGCCVSLICSIFGDGMKRALGLTLSLVGIFLCTPLGAGY